MDKLDRFKPNLTYCSSLSISEFWDSEYWGQAFYTVKHLTK